MISNRNGRWAPAELFILAIAAVVAVRLVPVSQVFRGDDVLLSGNDPWYYRYWIERVGLEELPGAVADGEPLFVVTMRAVVELAGVGAGVVLAWYPVVAAVIVAALVYGLAREVTGDHRVGFVAVLVLATVPAHAMRTGVGYGDHHAFDFIWLAATAYGVVLLVNRDWRWPRRYVLDAAVGGAIAAQVLAWEAGALLVVPVGFAIVVVAWRAVRVGESPAAACAPLLASMAVASVIVEAAHTYAGYHSALVASTPGALLVAGFGVVAVAEITLRLSPPMDKLAVAIAGFGAIVAIHTISPVVWPEIVTLVDGPRAAETHSLLDVGATSALTLLGLAIFVAAPPLVWAARSAERRPAYAIVAIYAWFFLLLAALQVRFVGEAAHFVAVFAAVGLVGIASRIGAIDVDAPDPWAVVAAVLLVGAVVTFGAVQTDALTDEATVDDEEAAVVAWLDDNAEEYVLSRWGSSRLYNYHTTGDARSYGYARNHYQALLGRPDEWHREHGDRVGYVVASRDVGLEDAAHFRPVYRSPGGELTVYRFVNV